jgi:hypothetical protein
MEPRDYTGDLQIAVDNLSSQIERMAFKDNGDQKLFDDSSELFDHLMMSQGHTLGYFRSRRLNEFHYDSVGPMWFYVYDHSGFAHIRYVDIHISFYMGKVHDEGWGDRYYLVHHSIELVPESVERDMASFGSRTIRRLKRHLGMSQMLSAGSQDTHIDPTQDDPTQID